MSERLTDKKTTLCFTGHRAAKLPDGGYCTSPAVMRIKERLYAEIIRAADEGYTDFITGMQNGIDLWAGDMVVSLMKQRPVHLTAVLPYRTMCDSFIGADRFMAENIFENADNIVVLNEEYTKFCMAQRNRWMIDRSSAVIAVIGSEQGGTAMTVSMAKKQGLDIRIIDPLG